MPIHCPMKSGPSTCCTENIVLRYVTLRGSNYLALEICAYNGAYASHEEATKGSIAAGKLADFTVLAEDPHDVDPSVIKDIVVARTVLGGRTTYEG